MKTLVLFLFLGHISTHERHYSVEVFLIIPHKNRRPDCCIRFRSKLDTVFVRGVVLLMELILYLFCLSSDMALLSSSYGVAEAYHTNVLLVVVANG